MGDTGKDIVAAAVEHWRKIAAEKGEDFDAENIAARTRCDLIMIGLNPKADRLRKEYLKDYDFSAALDRVNGGRRRRRW